MTYIPSNPNLDFLAGSKIKSFRPFAPFDLILREFLKDLSYELINKPESRTYPDIMAFAFWCRKANINKIKKRFEDGLFRLGLGLVFHITTDWNSLIIRITIGSALLRTVNSRRGNGLT